MKRLIAIGAAAALSLGLLGCGDKPQTSGTRKADSHPYTAATGTHTAAGWKAGDAASWESQLKSRTQNGQNEYTRTGPR
jgi:hypothetical protein